MKLEVAFVSSYSRRHIPEAILSSLWQISRESCGELDAVTPKACSVTADVELGQPGQFYCLYHA